MIEQNIYEHRRATESTTIVDTQLAIHILISNENAVDMHDHLSTFFRSPCFLHKQKGLTENMTNCVGLSQQMS